jgi:hypothetical protein
MRKYVLFMLFALTLGLVSCEKDEEIILSVSDYPTEIVSYVETTYPEDEILQIIKDIDDKVTTYDVLLKSGINLEFNSSFQLIEIDKN